MGLKIKNFNQKDRCLSCGCEYRDMLETHHITYTPEQTAPLCTICHLKVTALNTQASLRLGKKLPNGTRLSIFWGFIGSRIKPEVLGGITF